MEETTELDTVIFFHAQGHCFPNTLSQFLCWNIDKQNCETLSLLQFSKHMLLCARVCESVIVLACLHMCAYVCQKTNKKTPLCTVDEHCC